ncbi:branched-chain amino acid ABC transporter permease [Roseovarius spongiae]|uniref:Branched-chain amino acid ABC transporter permease n=1 Tax=Roseovarius spongiae TaxID=2320272 RepID=A0A3A8BA11_9RHOB|nr:branched-chain amino acid ABC transporter permease [Roseovarius spongiae]RKF15305.1 branched-chain amino acid ABC transporter permease [Roseovarius spongiae]
MEQTDRSSRIAWAALLLASLIAPVVVGFDKYLIHVGIIISLNVALATSLWMIWSLGFISFAHAGFMGIGAYTSALLFTKLGLSMWYGLWLGAAMSGAIALVIALPLMRTRAVYFFMASWAVGEVIKRNFAYFRDFFGGWDGVFNIRAPKLDLGFVEVNFADRLAYYYLALFFVVLTVLVIHRINNSRTGMIYWSIHENELLAQHAGINVFRHKVIAFTIACALAGLTGALYAHYQTYISPKSFDIWKSEFALVHVIVGGLTTVGGPVAGAISLTVVDELLRATGYFRTVFFGAVLIAAVLLLPGGLETIPGRLRSFFKRSDK